MRRLFSALLLFVIWQSVANAEEKCGVVFMHGKWGMPDKFIGSVVSELRDIGCLVETPEMPWSGRRLYDQPVGAGIAEIDDAVARLRSAGATAIFVGGHSMGASAAIGYAAQRPLGLKGVLAIAPGHDPSTAAFIAKLADSMQKARAMIAEGHGLDVASFDDLNGGRARTISTAAEIYFGYFDPAGFFVMPESVLRLHVPLLWVSGDSDPLTRLGKDYVFAKAPADPHNAYIVVSADHLGTPDAAAAQIAQWVRGVLPQN
ncbi:MAG TPA: alpha/beta hydrolase [Telmatospirillum sp.]|nr:alpha/beta hydrolase [Telmatospirillum sp.]